MIAATRLALALLLTAAAPLAGCAAAAGPVTPATIEQALGRAHGGDRIVLAAGDYGRVQFPARIFSPALKIDARAARFSALVLRGVTGVEVEGGTVVGPGGRSYGVHIDQSRDIRIANMAIGGAHRGIVVNRSQRVSLDGNRLEGLIAEGINVALSQHIRIERNLCRGFNPTPATYDGNGKRLRDGDHPDCIQAWSRPEAPPTGDLLIADNRMDGHMQGIFLGNHIRNGVNDGGFDRVTVRDNDITVTMPNGIVVNNARDATITGNTVRTVKGAVMPNRPNMRVKAALRFDGERVRACGNKVEAVPRSPGTEPC